MTNLETRALPIFTVVRHTLPFLKVHFSPHTRFCILYFILRTGLLSIFTIKRPHAPVFSMSIFMSILTLTPLETYSATSQ